MSGPKTEARRTEAEIEDKEAAAKGEIAEIVPMVNRIPTDAIDEELVAGVDRACKAAEGRAETARKGSSKRSDPSNGGVAE